jgi:hypothetical protein
VACHMPQGNPPENRQSAAHQVHTRSRRAAAQDTGYALERRDASGAAAAAGAAATSLIPQTLEEMRGDAEGAATRDLLARRGQVSTFAAQALHAPCSLAGR